MRLALFDPPFTDTILNQHGDDVKSPVNRVFIPELIDLHAEF